MSLEDGDSKVSPTVVFSAVASDGRQVLEHLINSGVTLGEFTRWMSRAYLMTALEVTKGNKTKAARIAGLHRNTFTRDVEKYNIPPWNPRAKERR